jgi:transcription initiation factor TFIIB
MTKCPECGSRRLQTSENLEVTCPDCGLVIEDTPLHQDSFITEGVKNTAEHPYLMKAGSKAVDGRIYKAHWLLSTREKNLQAGISRIELLASTLKLPERALNEAKLIFKQALENDLGVGRDNLTLTYASVYAACQINSIPKTPLELVAFSEVTKAQMLRTYKLIKTKLGLRIQPTDPTDLVPRFATRLNLKQETQTLAIEILTKLKKTNIAHGRHPETLVAAAMYIAAKQKQDQRTQREIANAIGVIEVTIRKRSREIQEMLIIK